MGICKGLFSSLFGWPEFGFMNLQFRLIFLSLQQSPVWEVCFLSLFLNLLEKICTEAGCARARARVQCVLWRGCWTMLRTSCGWEQKRWWCWWRCQENTRINPSGSCDLMGWFIYWRWVLCWGYRLVCEETAAVAGERICSCSCRRILIFFQARRWRGSLVSLIAEREFTRATLLATRILEGVLIRWRKKRTSPCGRGIKRKDKHNYIHDDDESCD
jgi:hypothetical protein